MWNQMLPGFRMTLLLTVLTGVLYPGVVTVICQAVFPKQAAGSLIERDGKVIGSALLGQGFSALHYFHPRPSAAGSEGYDAASSSGSNLGPTSQKLVDRVKAAREQAGGSNEIPSDLLTTSASGLDPHISPASALRQAERVAQARGMQEAAMREMIGRFTEGRDLGFLGEPRVNVLLLNLALDEQYPLKK
jgi:potassium-transporting ATPase KdpC subunit